MISQVYLRNIRQFADQDWYFGFGPLTVLCGTNGAGKSTVLKSLLMLKQSVRQATLSATPAGRPIFVGELVDLGNYQSLVSNCDTSKRMTIGFSTQNRKNIELPGKSFRTLNCCFQFGLKQPTSDIDELTETAGLGPVLEHAELKSTGESNIDLEVNRSEDGKYFMDVSPSLLRYRDLSIKKTDGSKVTAETTLSGLFPEYLLTAKGEAVPVPREIRELGRNVDRDFRRLSYIGPLRAPAKRFYAAELGIVSNLFGKLGLESKLTRSSRDGGVDCVAFDSRPVLGGKVIIQAKRYKHTVGVSAVRDLFGTMQHEGANKGILVTTSGYGPDAFEFIKDKPMELIAGGQLLYLLDQIGVECRIVFPAE